MIASPTAPWVDTSYSDTTGTGWVTVYSSDNYWSSNVVEVPDLDAEAIVAMRARERARSQRIQASLQPPRIREQRRGRDPHVPTRWLQRKHS
jgi:hypothetical protein